MLGTVRGSSGVAYIHRSEMVPYTIAPLFLRHKLPERITERRIPLLQKQDMLRSLVRSDGLVKLPHHINSNKTTAQNLPCHLQQGLLRKTMLIWIIYQIRTTRPLLGNQVLAWVFTLVLTPRMRMTSIPLRRTRFMDLRYQEKWKNFGSCLAARTASKRTSIRATNTYVFHFEKLNYSRLVNHASTLNFRLQGFTPLHLACDRGHIEAVRILLACGARVNIQVCCFSSALYEACFTARAITV